MKYFALYKWAHCYKYYILLLFIIIIIIIINEFHRDASLKQNFRAAVCHVLH